MFGSQSKIILFQFFLLITLPFLWGAEDLSPASKLTPKSALNQLIKCLGREEEQIHDQKINGPLYKLNQILLNKLILMDVSQTGVPELKKICQSKTYPPTLQFLRYLLLQREKTLSPSRWAPLSPAYEDQDQIAREQRLHQIEQLVAESQHIFLSYLAQLESLVPRPQCLEEKIPELAEIRARFFYLEDRMDQKDLITRDEIIYLFKKISHFDQIIEQCQKVKEKEDPSKNPSKNK